MGKSLFITEPENKTVLSLEINLIVFYKKDHINYGTPNE